MKRVTVRELQEIYSTRTGKTSAGLHVSSLNSFLIGKDAYYATTGDSYGFLEDQWGYMLEKDGVRHYYATIDDNFVSLFGDMEFLYDFDDNTSDDEILLRFNLSVQGVLIRKENDMSKLRVAFHTQYKPLDNYNRVDNVEITHDGETLDDAIYGESKVTSNKGQQVDEQVNGARENSTEYGATKQTNVLGAANQTVTEGIAGDNATDFVNANKTRTENEDHTDVVNTDVHSDKQTSKSYTDRITSGAREDTATTAEHTDYRTTMNNYTDKHKVTSTGNIGVRSSQELMQQEYNLRFNNDMVMFVFNLIVTELLTFHDDGYDAENTPFQNIFW